MNSSGLPSVSPYVASAVPSFSPQCGLLREEHEIAVLSDGRRPDPQGTTVINVQTFNPPPPDYLTWSLFNTLYMNFCCLGFIALIFSVKARDHKVLGDVSGAHSYAATSRCLNITALVLSLTFIILVVVLLVTGVLASLHMVSQSLRMNRD
ncbi:interferon-induced transmembrane protein 1-like [Tachyglossus aculeatus]|uniref:interferon-induced transmembrane protein 1-like n=1 Tax=Tachyglossus aculeatus TaxID=9261 RepID=UPI0018F68DAD|nr:interferon-induced transmembrane protein 1-like [Tachyglossus aculeatus]